MSVGGRWPVVLLGWLVIAAACHQTTPPTAPTTTTPPRTAATTPPTTAPVTTTTVEGAIPSGGQAVIGVIQEPTTLNPLLEEAATDFTLRLIGQAVWPGVQEIDARTRELIPDLVIELPSVENGGLEVADDGSMTIRYRIREEAVWEDGTPITGFDFEFTYRTILDRRWPIRGAVRRAYQEIVPGSIVAEEKSFEYRLARPSLHYEFLFSVVLPAHHLEGSDFARDWEETMWLSGGPFRFAEWRPGEFMRLERNPRYWRQDPETGQALPFLDALVFRFVPDQAALLSAFKRRRVDVINPAPHLEIIRELQALEGVGAEVQVRRGPDWEHLNFQFGGGRLQRNPDSLNEHLEYRRAIAHLVDRRAITEAILQGILEPLDSFVDLYWLGASQGAWARYPHDPEEARRLLGELGRKLERDFEEDPPRAVFTTTNEPERIRLAELLVRMFEAGGIELEVELEERAVFFGDSVARGTYDLGEWAWIASQGRSGLVRTLRDVFHRRPPDGLNFYRWTSLGEPNEAAERAEEILAGLDTVVDEVELRSQIMEVERILADEVVIIPLYSSPDVGVVWADRLAGYQHNPTSAGDTWNVELWYRLDYTPPQPPEGGS